jgi:hypothetical protein
MTKSDTGIVHNPLQKNNKKISRLNEISKKVFTFAGKY